MGSSGRCPRCGYVLRYSTTHYACDFCGLRGKRSISSILGAVEEALKKNTRRSFEPLRVNPDQRIVQRVQACQFCRATLTIGSTLCGTCGRIQPDILSELDKRVLDYISNHGGVISISLGAQELSITLQTLTNAIERLKAAGLLNQE
jgi:hypothetical protein